MPKPFTLEDNPFLILYEEIMANRKIISDLQATINKFMTGEKKETYLSPEEARQVFKPNISKPTLYRWTKSGLMKRHIIGGRVCYKLSEIEDAAKTNSVYKAKCPVETGQILQ